MSSNQCCYNDDGLVPCKSEVFEIGGTNFLIQLQKAIPSRQEFFEIIKNRNGKLSHHHDNGNVLNRTSMDIDVYNTKLSDEII